MAIYTKANNVPTEAIYVDSCSRITTQEAMFLNPKNVYWGLFEGRFNISSGTIANVVIDNATFRYPLKFEDLSANYMKAVTAVLSDAYVNNLSVNNMSSVTFVDLTAYNSHTGSTYSMTFKDVYDNIALSIETLSNNLSTEIDNLSAALSGEIDVLSAKLSSEIDQLSTDLSGEIGYLSTSLSNEIKALSGSLSGEIDSLSTSLSNDIKQLSSDLSGEIDSLSTDLSTEISSLAKSLSVEGVLVKNKLSFGYDKDTKQIQFQVYDISGNQYLSSINTRDFADDFVVSCARIENISGDNYLVIYWNNDDPAQVSTAIPLSSISQTYTSGTGISVSTTPTEDVDTGLSYKISVTDYVATYKQLSDVSTILSNDLSTKIWIENKVDQSKSPGFSDLSIVTLSKEQYAEAMSNKSPYGNMDKNVLYLISSDNLDMFGQKIEHLTMTDDNVQSEAVNKNYVDRLSISFNNKIADLSGEIDVLSAKLSNEIDQLSADLSGEIDVLSGALSGEIKQLSTSLSNAISSKVFVGKQTQSSVMGNFTDLSVIKISKDDYEAAVATAAKSGINLSNNVLYVISSDYIDAYEQQIKNVVMEDDNTPSEAATKHFVEQLSDRISQTIDNNIDAICAVISNDISGCISSINDTIDYKLCVAISNNTDDISTKIWIENRVDQSISAFSNLSVVTLSKDQYAAEMANKSPYGNMDKNVLYLISSDNLDMFNQKIVNLTMSVDNVPSEAVNKHYIDNLADNQSASLNALSIALSGEIDQLSSDLSGEISSLSAALSTEIDNLSTDLSNTISSKIFVGEYTQSTISGDFTDLSVIKISKDDYEAAVVNAAKSGVDLSDNVLYVISSDYIDAYGQQIKNVVMQDDNTPSEAATKHYVDNYAEGSTENTLSIHNILSAFDNSKYAANQTLSSGLNLNSDLSVVLSALVEVWKMFGGKTT